MSESGIKLLFVEDSRIEQRFFQRLVEKQKLPYEYQISASVADTRVMLREREYDVVVTDYLLEDGNAFEFFDLLHEIPTIVVTAAEDRKVAVTALRRGASDYLIKDGDGSHLEALPHAIDLALRRKKAARELQLLSHAIMNISDSVFITDMAGIVIFVNRAFCNTFGYEPEEILGQERRLLYSSEQPQLSESEISGSIEALLTKCRKNDGTEFPVLVSHSVVTAETRSGEALSAVDGSTASAVGPVALATVARDMSDVVRAEKDKRELEAQLRQSQKMEAVGILAGGIAHDFNSILGSIIGYTELAAADLSQEVRSWKNLQESLKAAFRARNLVEQILTFSRQATGVANSVQLSLAVEEVLSLVRPTLPKKIVISSTLAQHAQILGDSAKIHQMVLNLITNALYAMQSGGGTLRVDLVVRDCPEGVVAVHSKLPRGRYSVLTVSDTGSGISLEDQRKIFDPFFTTKPVGSGTGLGLSIVHGIVVEHQGGILVRTEAGRGTTFEVYLPQQSVCP